MSFGVSRSVCLVLDHGDGKCEATAARIVDALNVYSADARKGDAMWTKSEGPPTHECPYCHHRWRPVEMLTSSPAMYRCPTCKEYMVVEDERPDWRKRVIVLPAPASEVNDE